jgi:type II secretory pathway component PulJ
MLKVPRKQRGLSVIEIMVALAASLIVIGSVLAFTVAMARASAESVRYTRLTQDLRASMALMSREIRRAGHNAAALAQIGTGATVPIYSLLLVGEDGEDVAGDCIVFGYDRVVGGVPQTPGVIETEEWKGFRRIETEDGVGVLQMRRGGADDSVGEPCSDDGHAWIDVTDPRVMNVTFLEFDTARSFEVVGDQIPDPEDLTRTIDLIVGVRSVDITLRAALLTEPEIQREVRQAVRVRAETLRSEPTPAP